MPSLIILKLVPSQLILPALFRKALDGLEITMYSLTV